MNPKECADAANDLSLQDYSDLLISSGYFTLVQLATQLRHAATQPDPERDRPRRGPAATASEARVRSHGRSAPSGADSSSLPLARSRRRAWREPQERTCVRHMLNPADTSHSALLIHYRILLRTLAWAFPPRGWGEPGSTDGLQTQPATLPTRCTAAFSGSSCRHPPPPCCMRNC